jgi:hypothetical protein
MAGTHHLRGGYLRRARRRLSSLHRPAKVAYALLFTVLPGVLAYLAFFAPGGDDRQDRADAETAPTSTTANAPTTTATTVPPVEDPYLYANFEGTYPRRSQECDGLLGLCMGQPIDIALQMFGPDEDTGFPLAVAPDPYTVATKCHRWAPPRFEAVDVCEADGGIVSVELTFSSEATFALALPHDVIVRFPDALTTSAEIIAEGLGDEPFESSFVQAENEDVAGFDWYLPWLGEGGPETVLMIDGRRQWAENTEFIELPPCTPDGASYRYGDVAAITTDIMVETVRVARAAPAHLAAPECG